MDLIEGWCGETGSWDKTVKFWSPGNPTAAATIQVGGITLRNDTCSFVRHSRRGRGLTAGVVVGGAMQLAERCYCMDMRDEYLVVGCADRHVQIFDVRKPTQPLKSEQSPLKYQTRTVSE